MQGKISRLNFFIKKQFYVCLLYSCCKRFSSAVFPILKMLKKLIGLFIEKKIKCFFESYKTF